MTEYRSGTCNINQKESKKRLVAGVAGFSNALILTAVLLFFPSLQLLYVPIFLLLCVGFLGVLQYRKNFCAGLGLKGKFHVGNSEAEVDDPDRISQDRREAMVLITKSICLSSVVVFSIYLLI
jgi:hypothetical protein